MAKRAVARCDAKLASYRATLDAHGDPETVAKWMADVAQEQQAARDALALARSAATANASARLRRADVERMVRQMGEATAILSEGEAADKLALYQRIGLRLTYQPTERTVLVEAAPTTRVRNVVSEGGLEPLVLTCSFVLCSSFRCWSDGLFCLCS